MAVSFPSRDELAEVLELVGRQARDYLAGVDERPVLAPGAAAAEARFERPLPETGAGAGAALRELYEQGLEATVATSGPRCFHFVTGGVTPAALGADWLQSALDQQAYAWVTSPLGVRLERVALGWLEELFELPRGRAGVITTGATMANFVALAAARQWWGERQGVDVSEEGMAGLPPLPVFSSGHLHASAVKVLALLGVGRAQIRKLAADPTGRLDLVALERELAALGGAPAIVIGNAGEVNVGEFDPLGAMADLAERHGAWLHVDGAFGLFARLSPRSRHLTEGVERARSVTVDGHKWLNVPHDCGFVFVDDRELLARAFAYQAAYLPPADDPRPVIGALGPESTRRARALAVWATLRAYGRTGYRELVERHLDLAQRLAARVDAAPELERLAEVPLNIVCFRAHPAGLDDPAALDDFNRRLGAAIVDDGRVYAGTTDYAGRVALRPALVNWRTRPEDVDLFVEVVRELTARLAAG